MHTICETRAFERAAADAGMSRDEVDAVVALVATSPNIGDVMQGTGGCRKLRFGGRGKGKSGGFRIITFFTGPTLPVFLITGFGKGETANLTQREPNGLAVITTALISEYRTRTTPSGGWR